MRIAGRMRIAGTRTSSLIAFVKSNSKYSGLPRRTLSPLLPHNYICCGSLHFLGNPCTNMTSQAGRFDCQLTDVVTDSR